MRRIDGTERRPDARKVVLENRSNGHGVSSRSAGCDGAPCKASQSLRGAHVARRSRRAVTPHGHASLLSQRNPTRIPTVRLQNEGSIAVGCRVVPMIALCQHNSTPYPSPSASTCPMRPDTGRYRAQHTCRLSVPSRQPGLGRGSGPSIRRSRPRARTARRR